jgi:tyrosinase
VDRPSPELAGASQIDISLAGGGPARVEVPLEHPALSTFSPTIGLAEDSPKLFLALENVRASNVGASAYEVHVGVPDDADPTDFPQLQAGRISTFGIIEATTSQEPESGSGRTYSFDISGLVETLKEEGRWDPSNLRVAITPVARDDEDASAGDIKVGRVGVYYG